MPCLRAYAPSGIRTHDPLITSREHEPLHYSAPTMMKLNFKWLNNYSSSLSPSRGVDPGGGGGAVAPPPPNENIGGRGANISFCPPPPPKKKKNYFDNSKNSYVNARIGLKSIVRHYKTIKFNIEILLNIHNSHKFCGAHCAQAPPKIVKFSLILPPPNPKSGSTPVPKR